MQLVINSRGAYLRKKGECFEIKVDEKKTEISARKVQTILITTAVLISTDAILLAHEHNIDISFIDHYGNPFSRIWHAKFGSTAFIRRMQLELSDSKEGVDLAKKWVDTKISNQSELLEKLSRTRESKKDEILVYREKLEKARRSLDLVVGDSIENIRGTIMGYEGNAGRVYFEALNFVMPEQYKFSGRSRSPAQDSFNAFLNYGYGVLYSKVERACIISGLDPYIGFLHVDNYGKKSFVFDVIELFRCYVDEVVIKLFSKRMVNQDSCSKIKNGITLEKPGKELLITELMKHLDDKIRYKNRNVKRIHTLDLECHRIANSLIGKEGKDVDLVNL